MRKGTSGGTARETRPHGMSGVVNRMEGSERGLPVTKTIGALRRLPYGNKCNSDLMGPFRFGDAFINWLAPGKTFAYSMPVGNTFLAQLPAK